MSGKSLRVGFMLLVGLAAMGGGCGAVAADVVEFNNGKRLECRVVRLTPDGGVMVSVGEGESGSLVLPATSIRRIEYDFAAKLAALIALRSAMPDTEFNRALYDLAVDTEARSELEPELLKEALRLYAFLIEEDARPGVPVDAWLRMARYHEEEGRLSDALTLWRKALAMAPENAEARSAVARLEALAAAGAKPAEPEPASPAVAPAALRNGREGMELQSGWRSLDAYNPSTVRVVEDTSNNTKMLELTMDGKAAKDKSIFRLVSSHQGGRNLSKAKALVIERIFVPAGVKGGMPIAVSITTGPRHEWFESRDQRIKPGEWQGPIRFDLEMKNWKSQATGWRFSTDPKNLDQVQAVHILLNGNNSGTCYISGMRFVEE